MSNTDKLPTSNDERAVRDAIWLRECRERRTAAWSAFYDACQAARVELPRYGESSYDTDKDAFRLALADSAALRMLWVAWSGAASEEQLAEEASKARVRAAKEAALCAGEKTRPTRAVSPAARVAIPTTTATSCGSGAASVRSASWRGASRRAWSSTRGGPAATRSRTGTVGAESPCSPMGSAACAR